MDKIRARRRGEEGKEGGRWEWSVGIVGRRGGGEVAGMTVVVVAGSIGLAGCCVT